MLGATGGFGLNLSSGTVPCSSSSSVRSTSSAPLQRPRAQTLSRLRKHWQEPAPERFKEGFESQGYCDGAPTTAEATSLQLPPTPLTEEHLPLRCKAPFSSLVVCSPM